MTGIRTNIRAIVVAAGSVALLAVTLAGCGNSESSDATASAPITRDYRVTGSSDGSCARVVEFEGRRYSDNAGVIAVKAGDKIGIGKYVNCQDTGRGSEEQTDVGDEEKPYFGDEEEPYFGDEEVYEIDGVDSQIAVAIRNPSEDNKMELLTVNGKDDQVQDVLKQLD